MKKLGITLALFITVSMYGQKKWYVNTNYEVIFSLANTEYKTYETNNVMRFAPWFSIQSEYNYDLSQKFGLLTGFGVRNIGFIYDVPSQGVKDDYELNKDKFSDKYSANASIRKKFRNYALGVPVGFKVGNMNSFYFFGGYEIELPFHYKEKTFINGSKEYKHSNWFDNAIPAFYHSAFAGFQLPHGGVLKFKYYFTDFFKQDYVQRADGDAGRVNINWSEKKNYYPSKAGLFYVSLTFRLFRNAQFYYEDEFDSTTYSMRANVN